MTTGNELEVNLNVMLGLNNRRPDFRLRTKDGSFARSAPNVVVSESGSLKRRAGYTKQFAGTDCHSLWVSHTDVGFYVDGTTLYRVRAGGADLVREVIASDLARGRTLTYAEMGTDVVFSDGITNRCVGDEGIRVFGVPELAVQPMASAGIGGALTAGVYQITFAYGNDQFELSGCTPAQLVDVSDNGKITVAGLPASWPVGVAVLVIYVSQPGGSTMFSEVQQLAPATTATISQLSGSGMQATTYLQRALPAGSILRFYASRMYAAAGPVLWYSNVYSPALCSPAKNYVQFVAPITVMEPCDGGMYVVADATYWLAGDITSTELKTVAPYTGVLGSGMRLPHEQGSVWMTPRGIAKGSPTGEVELLQDENVAVSRAAAGATLVQEQDGQRFVASSLFGAEGASAAARSYMDAEVIRKGTT